MTAIARTDMIMQFEERGRLRFYVPLTAPNWKRSDPLVYFLQTNITAYVGPDGQVQSLDAKTPPFRMTQTGVLVRNDLPGPVAEAFRRHNLTLAAPHQVLELSPGADVAPYWVAAGVGGLVGFILVLVGGLASLQRRRAMVPSGSDAG